VIEPIARNRAALGCSSARGVTRFAERRELGESFVQVREGNGEMIGKLMEFFAAPADARNGRAGVNVQKRFLRLADVAAQGSMSRVFKATDTETGKMVCVKVLDREKNEAALARASRHEERPSEGAVAVQFNHPNIVRTYEYGTGTKGEQYLAMEYVSGKSFESIGRDRLGRTAQKVEWLAQAAEGIAAIHEAGFIHHDINPRNFLINREHQVKIIDFGLAVPNTPAFRKPGNRTGCLLYMAPELLRREPIDERIDIFSFGAVAFELLTHRLPFGSHSSPNSLLQRFSQPPDDPVRLQPKLSQELGETLLKLVAVDKRDRWPTMSTLAEHLRAIPAKR